ncbi:hypothetical protein BIT28_07570 [Photobacterium proteolyticum]|uniref:Uncharacterized protein n=1 Tax=Photobacterium proteolyticum TaxID=1903952 RepID=A0A1Q9G6H3_9GAMM|nr:MBL fold metallo-hydrolase [Photobacterium proteolyticum]OLQ69867.1 hypothetical protein BIT28_07570 [Photobacterium proteolyticum]
MGFEVDFHAVGEETKSGDAISMRFVEGDEQFVIVIDGGFKSDGEKVVNTVKNHYGTNYVDLVISTHPDQDHINGLFEVLETMEVGELWIKKPWEHGDLASLLKDGRFTDNSVGEKLAKQLNKAVDLVNLAEEKGIPVREPFSGCSINKCGAQIISIGPDLDYYRDLIPEILTLEPALESKSEASFVDRIIEKAKSIFRAVWGEDDLDEDAKTSALNSTSAITLINYDGQSLLFTGDAGIDALNDAYPLFEAHSNKLRLMQIPHHGSRRNISSSVLDCYIGEPLADKNASRGITAIASAAQKSEKHPRPAVLNAFIHRGVKTLATNGKGIRHHNNLGAREGWNAAEVEVYQEEYERE